MHELIEQKPAPFIDRRQIPSQGSPSGHERRQFRDSRSSEKPEVAELAEAVDQYKLRHRRRFITFDELYDVMIGLGYHK